VPDDVVGEGGSTAVLAEASLSGSPLGSVIHIVPATTEPVQLRIDILKYRRAVRISELACQSNLNL
jgi:hypothetical protein